MESAPNKSRSGPGLGAVIVPLLTFVVGFAAGHLVADFSQTVPKVKLDSNASGQRAGEREHREERAMDDEMTPEETGEEQADDEQTEPSEDAEQPATDEG